MPSDLQPLFLLRPDVTFLNHGSFGACPRPVFEEYGRWQREFEEEPVEFFVRRAPGLLRESRRILGAYVGCDADDLVYVTNATIGVNIVARSLQLSDGDEVLATNHEYGACERIWNFLSARRGFSYRPVQFPLPVTTHEAFVERMVAEITPATRLIFISHISSPTGLVFPVAEICRIARERGIMTLIDGAHIAGQLPLDLDGLGADFYTGNLHKWLCAPKGSAFLYVRRELQPMLEPLVISWGWEAAEPGPSQFIDHHELWGTRDIAAFLSTAAAIRFQEQHDWTEVRARCRRLVREGLPVVAEACGGKAIVDDPETWFAQMGTLRLPDSVDGVRLQRRLFDEHRVEVPVFAWQPGVNTLRFSIQGYNSWDDIEAFAAALRALVA